MQPLVTLQDNGSAVLSYDIPQPTIYRGRVTYQIPVGPLAFNPVSNPFAGLPAATPALADIRKAMINGFVDPTIFPQLGVPPNYLAYVDDQPDVPIKYLPWQGFGDLRQVNPTAFYKGVVMLGVHGYDPATGSYVGPQVGFAGAKDRYITDELAMLTPEVVQSRLAARYRLFISKNNAGQYTCAWELVDPSIGPSIAIIERYQLSSFLGSYGAGRTLQTFTLLPGEKSRISIKSYVRTTTTTKSASSVLDSYDDQSAQEFSDAVTGEHTSKLDQRDSLKWHVEVEAEADWGFVSARASAGYKGGTNASREQFGKEMSHAVSKHATKASSKRDIKVQQSQEATAETGEESGVEREIQNVNVGRTLNFVFRQLNQEYITLLHLVDVEIGYSTGFPGGGKRYALSELEKLLTDAIKPAGGYRETVRAQILAELQNVVDHRGDVQSFIESVSLDAAIPAADRGGAPAATYYRPRRALRSSYTSAGGKVIRDIPGIVLSATETVLRTGGVIVEALLGQGEGLDDYSRNLQITAANAAQNANSLQTALGARKQLVATVAASGDINKGKLYAMLYPNEPRPPLPAGGTGK